MEAMLTFNIIETNGSIDEAATEDALLTDFRSAMQAFQSERSKVASAVDAVFDRHMGKRINLPHVASLAMVHLDVAPEDFTRMQTLCLDYIRANAQGDNSLFVMGKGSKNGGVARRTNLLGRAA